MTSEPADTDKMPPEPVPLTEKEVAALAGRRTGTKPGARSDASVAVKRLNAHSPAAPTGRLETEKATPPRISRKEMDGIRRAHMSTKKVRERFTQSDVPAVPSEDRYSPKARPERGPSPKGTTR